MKNACVLSFLQVELDETFCNNAEKYEILSAATQRSESCFTALYSEDTVATVCNCTWKTSRDVETQSERAKSGLRPSRTEFLCFKASSVYKINQTVDPPDDSAITDSSGFCIPAFFSQQTSTKVQK